MCPCLDGGFCAFVFGNKHNLTPLTFRFPNCFVVQELVKGMFLFCSHWHSPGIKWSSSRKTLAVFMGKGYAGCVTDQSREWECPCSTTSTEGPVEFLYSESSETIFACLWWLVCQGTSCCCTDYYRTARENSPLGHVHSHIPNCSCKKKSTATSRSVISNEILLYLCTGKPCLLHVCKL